MEQWKKIPGFEAYEASTLGNIRNAKGHILKPWLDGGGHYGIQLGRGNKFTLHRLIALTFIPEVDGKPYVDHINQNKTDNRVENLRWATRSENGLNTADRTANRNIYVHQAGGYSICVRRREQGVNIWAYRKTLEEAIQCRDEIIAKLDA
jgi:hypothetical protein